MSNNRYEKFLDFLLEPENKESLKIKKSLTRLTQIQHRIIQQYIVDHGSTPDLSTLKNLSIAVLPTECEKSGRSEGASGAMRAERNG
jgi:hypothetical protein